MLDLALIGFVGLFLLAGLKRPFFWVLAYIYIDICAPQKMGWGLSTALPMSLIAFLAAFGGWLLLDAKKDSRFTLSQGLIAVLLAYCGMTTVTAAFPVEAMAKWAWVWKALVFAIFLPLTLRTRLRLEAAVLVIVLSVSTIAINGGLKTVLGGGGYGELALLVREDSGLYEGSIISTVAVSCIPLVLWLTRFGTIFPSDWRVKLFAAGVIFACLVMPVGTSARTGLVCVAVLGVLLLRSVRHRFLYAALAGLALVVTVPFLPDSYKERMGTIRSFQGEQSASTRIEVWKWTLDYVAEHPWGGGFDAYLGNSFTYQMRKTVGEPPNVRVEYQQVTDQARAYHSSYFEMLGEQGWLGFAVWMWLQVIGLWQMERLRRRYARRKDSAASWQGGLALALQQTHAVYLAGAAFVGIALQPFLFMVIGLECALWSYVRRTEAVERKAVFKRHQPSPQAA